MTGMRLPYMAASASSQCEHPLCGRGSPNPASLVLSLDPDARMAAQLRSESLQKQLRACHAWESPPPPATCAICAARHSLETSTVSEQQPPALPGRAARLAAQPRSGGLHSRLVLAARGSKRQLALANPVRGPSQSTPRLAGALRDRAAHSLGCPEPRSRGLHDQLALAVRGGKSAGVLLVLPLAVAAGARLLWHMLHRRHARHAAGALRGAAALRLLQQAGKSTSEEAGTRVITPSSLPAGPACCLDNKVERRQTCWSQPMPFPCIPSLLKAGNRQQARTVCGVSPASPPRRSPSTSRRSARFSSSRFFSAPSSSSQRSSSCCFSSTSLDICARTDKKLDS